MNRRRFLGALAATAAWGCSAWPPPTRARPAAWNPRYGEGLPLGTIADDAVAQPVSGALAVARRHILSHCTEGARPNALNHGVRALGRDLPVGDDAFRFVLESLVQEAYREGQLLLEVPVRSEGHRHSFLKTLIEKSCPLDLEFHVGGHPYVFADYVRSARLLRPFDARAAIDEQSWAVLAFVRVVPPGQGRWLDIQGQVQDLDRILDATSEALRHDTRLIRSIDLRARPLPRDCDVLARACGGLHMLYALAAAESCGHTTQGRHRDFADHVRTLLRRFTYDLGVIDEVETLNRERVGPERAALRAFDGRIKFLGHSLEIIGLVDQFALVELEDDERHTVDAGRRQLCDWIVGSDALQFGGAASDEALFDSLVTGMCHAYNGLRMSPA